MQKIKTSVQFETYVSAELFHTLGALGVDRKESMTAEISSLLKRNLVMIRRLKETNIDGRQRNARAIKIYDNNMCLWNKRGGDRAVYIENIAREIEEATGAFDIDRGDVIAKVKSINKNYCSLPAIRRRFVHGLFEIYFEIVGEMPVISWSGYSKDEKIYFDSLYVKSMEILANLASTAGFKFNVVNADSTINKFLKDEIRMYKSQKEHYLDET